MATASTPSAPIRAVASALNFGSCRTVTSGASSSNSQYTAMRYRRQDNRLRPKPAQRQPRRQAPPRKPIPVTRVRSLLARVAVPHHPRGLHEWFQAFGDAPARIDYRRDAIIGGANDPAAILRRAHANDG